MFKALHTCRSANINIHTALFTPPAGDSARPGSSANGHCRINCEHPSHFTWKIQWQRYCQPPTYQNTHKHTHIRRSIAPRDESVFHLPCLNFFSISLGPLLRAKTASIFRRKRAHRCFTFHQTDWMQCADKCRNNFQI